MASSIRWAFNCSQWTPTCKEWLLGLGCVQSEERIRILQFKHQEDAKASLVGRLMLQKFARDQFPGARFERTTKGKPVVRPSHHSSSSWAFNVSHQGQWTVFSGEKGRDNIELGVDIMRLDATRTQLQNFFRLMRRKFTEDEWETILSSAGEIEQLATFYRLWCLKESFVKANGHGLGWNLQRLSFKIRSPLRMSQITGQFMPVACTDTTLYIDGQATPDWQFQETLLSEDSGPSSHPHWVVTAIKRTGKQSDFPERPSFQIVNQFIDLLDRVTDTESSECREKENSTNDWNIFCDHMKTKQFSHELRTRNM